MSPLEKIENTSWYLVMDTKSDEVLPSDFWAVQVALRANEVKA